MHHITIVFERDLQAIERIEDAADVRVELGHRIANLSGRGLAGEVGMRLRGKVQLGHRVVEEERLAIA